MTKTWLRNTLPLWALSLPLATGCVGFIPAEDDGDGTGDDAGDGDGDNTGDGDGDTDGGVDMTIYEIQEGGMSGSVADGTQVTVRGVVVTSPLNTEDGLIFVEEPEAGEWSGISLYMWDEAVMASSLSPGDLVDLSGEYTEFFGTSQIVIKGAGDVVVVGQADLPGPDVVSASDVARDNAGAEPWEGVRVRVMDPVIEEANDGFGQYLLVGDALVGNAFVDPLPQVALEGSFASVTGSLHYTFDEFKIQPATSADLDGYDNPVDPTEATPIYDLQQDQVPLGTVVLLEGVIASSGLTWSDTADASFFVQDPMGGAYSGIQIHVTDIAGFQVEIGDQLDIVGIYDEFFEMSQVEIADSSAVMMTGTGAPPTAEVIADPATIATGGTMTEEWESVLVQVEGVTVTNANPDDPDEFGEFLLTGDLRVSDLFFAIADWEKPELDTAFTSVSGVLIYDFNDFKLAPRINADLVE